MELRSESRRGRREDRVAHGPDSPVPPDPVVDRIVLERALLRLPAPLRSVLLLKELEGYSHEEIGEMLGITSGASAARLHRAWKRLRKIMRATE